MQPDTAGTAPAFPAGHPAGTKADRAMDDKDGLTAKEALARLGVTLDAPGITYIDRLYDANLRRPLLDGLSDGSWYAKGFRVSDDPSGKPERMPPRLWSVLELDLEAGAASGGGLKYEGLRFFKKKTAEKSANREPVRLADLKRFMEKRITGLIEAGEQSSPRQDETAARAHFKDRSINRKWITRLRQECNAPLEWSKPGPRN